MHGYTVYTLITRMADGSSAKDVDFLQRGKAAQSAASLQLLYRLYMLGCTC